MALGQLRASLNDVDNPPLDVWLVWHAYMLNPTYELLSLSSISEFIVLSHALLSWYAEDLERLPLLADLKNIPVSPLDLLVCLWDFFVSVH